MVKNEKFGKLMKQNLFLELRLSHIRVNIGACTATCAWNKKIYWHGLVHLQLIEFPALEFDLLKSELSYLSSL